jgi:hypothetical protein
MMLFEPAKQELVTARMSDFDGLSACAILFKSLDSLSFSPKAKP